MTACCRFEEVKTCSLLGSATVGVVSRPEAPAPFQNLEISSQLLGVVVLHIIPRILSGADSLRLFEEKSLEKSSYEVLIDLHSL